MSRLQSLVSRPKRSLAALATVLVAVGITAASGASFNATSANAGNAFAAGTMKMDNTTPTGTAFILTAGNMKPGDPATVGLVDIENTGTLAGDFTLSKGVLTDGGPGNPSYKLSDKLNVNVVDCGVYSGPTAPTCGDSGELLVYNGSLADMGTVGHEIAPLGNVATTVRHRYEFRVNLISTTDDNYQGKTSTVAFAWAAAS
jgi:hypothetical protein